MVYVLISLMLLGASAMLLRPLAGASQDETKGLAQGRLSMLPHRVVDPYIGLAFVLAVFMVASPRWALGIVIAVLLHEAGHYIAMRMSGHRDVAFRIVPFLPLSPTTQPVPNSDDKRFFVSIFGSAFSLAPMVLLYTMGSAMAHVSDDIARQLTIIARSIAFYNFVLLLPLWPLAGGNCLRQILLSLAPRAVTHALLAASAAVAAFGFAFQSTLAVLLCLPAGLVFLGMGPAAPTGRPMTRKGAWLGAGAYLALIAANFACGNVLILWMFGLG